MTPPEPPGLTIRDVQPSDFSAIADLHVEALAEDGLYAFLHPHREAYPISYRKSFLDKVKQRYLSPNNRCFVAEVNIENNPDQPNHAGPGSDSRHSKHSKPKPQKRLIAFSSWQGTPTTLSDVHGDRPRPLSLTTVTFNALNLHLLSLESTYRNLFNLDPSFSHHNLTSYRTAESNHGFFPAISAVVEQQESLFLKFLIVHPDYQRMGIGGRMLDWGIGIAKRERIPAMVVGSSMGKGLYQKSGFEDLGSFKIVDELEAWALILKVEN